MLKKLTEKNWLKVVFLCVLMAVVITIPATIISAAKSTSPRTLLNNSITFCDKLSKSDYTSTTWKAFEKELKEAKTVYKKAGQKDSVYSTERDKLEKSKASLSFVTSTDKGNPLTFRKLSVTDIVDEMGAGWNLGNTMDGHSGLNPNETLWQSVTTTKAFIKAVHDSGFNTIRVPVTWGTKIDDKNGYKIDENWMNRVQDIVDYAVSQDMYVIINLHHDGAEQSAWIRVSSEDIDTVYDKFEKVWRQIAEKFKNYDEHLIFESMNEVTGDGALTTTEHDFQVIMNLNQIFVNVVRSTGSNNGERWLSVPGRYTNIDTTTNPNNNFTMPVDTVKNRLFLSVHHYDYAFGLADNMTTTTWSDGNTAGIAKLLKKVKDSFTSKGIPVILGEYGAVNKNNTVDRAYSYESFAKICQKYGIVACAWDSGDYDFSKTPDYTFSLFNRKTGESIYPSIVAAIMRGTYLTATMDDFSDVVKNPTVTNITEIKLSDSSLTMNLEDSKEVTVTVKPSGANDVVLWKTADPTVATVSNGHVRARGIGTTTLTAFSQSGSVAKTITVEVKETKVKKPSTSIITGKASYEIVVGSSVELNTKIQPNDTDDFVTYKSSDESIATVNAFGKIVGYATGSATITITASSGKTKNVKVDVITGESSKEITLALNVYYCDDNLKYYGNEIGSIIKVKGNGQYTVSFDCASNLSDNAIKAGITSISNLTAIYIKDYEVTKGTKQKSTLKSCKIMYDKITVDGKELTITQKEPKNAIKSSGILDTNGPFNGWEDNVVKEVSIASNHSLNIAGITNPKKLEITFTISDLEFGN